MPAREYPQAGCQPRGFGVTLRLLPVDEGRNGPGNGNGCYAFRPRDPHLPRTVSSEAVGDIYPHAPPEGKGNRSPRSRLRKNQCPCIWRLP